MEKTPVMAVLEEIPSITITQEKYDRLIAAEAKFSTFAAVMKYIPSYYIDDAISALFQDQNGKHVASEQAANVPAQKVSVKIDHPAEALDLSLAKGPEDEDEKPEATPGPRGGLTICGDDAVEMIIPPKTVPTEATPDA